MRTINKYAFGIAMLLTISSTGLFGQAPGAVISDPQKQAIFQKAVGLLKEHYIFPERIPAIEKFMNAKMAGKGYAQFVTLESFLAEFNKDLEREGNDHHLDIFFSPQRVKQVRMDEKNEKEKKKESFSDEWLEMLRYENFRLRKLERLDGNIGYFRFLNFPPLAPAKETITGAMNFIQRSSALIIDLRDNGGGYAETMQFLLSYFLKDSLQTGEWRYRKGNVVEKTYVPADTSVKKFPDGMPVYILVNKKTSSAAEGFSYILQQFKRAVVVGEQTKGEGNPGNLFVINDSLYIMIPTIESRNAVTGKGIDGIGVTPDIRIEAGKAQDMALLEIYRSLAKSTARPERKTMYEWKQPVLAAGLFPQQIPTALIESITGNYQDGKKIISENEAMYFINPSGKFRMDYLGNNIFSVSGKDYRLVFPGSAPVEIMQAVWEDGGKEEIKRVNK